MAFIPWGAEFSVSIASIDEQHKKLVGYVNELNDAMAQRKGKDVLEKSLADSWNIQRRILRMKNCY